MPLIVLLWPIHTLTGIIRCHDTLHPPGIIIDTLIYTTGIGILELLRTYQGLHASCIYNVCDVTSYVIMYVKDFIGIRKAKLHTLALLSTLFMHLSHHTQDWS